MNFELSYNFYVEVSFFYAASSYIKQSDPWDMEHLLSLLESWASAPSLTDFNLHLLILNLLGRLSLLRH